MILIKISLNGSAQEIPVETSINGLFSFLDLSDKFIAVELNNEIVFRANWEKVKLIQDDKVEIVRAIGGG
jgi:sulfur carrier protein|tara:strand:- start:1482 stop:1691 length:210 start_codon:yes stop_codon:yes gene_type:complete